VKSIDTVIFDLGNVLLFFNWEIATDRLSSRTGKSRQEIGHYFMTTPFAMQLERGELSKQRFYETVSHDMEFDGPYEEFALIWSDIFTPNEPVIALAQQLRGRARRLALSNTNEIHVEFILKRYPFIREMDGHVFSHEAGLMKPDARIYEFLLKQFGVESSRAVFIDDIHANVDGARAVGLHGIHYQSPEQLRQELMNLGLPLLQGWPEKMGPSCRA
jgi:epoxide hydrolase-like predicted phosphatase